MKLMSTRRCDYGLRALVYLAGREGERVKAAEISTEMNIPVGFLHQVLQELQRSRLVTSQTSRTGGYSLGLPATDVTLLDIVEALEGPIERDQCSLRNGTCDIADTCALHSPWSAAQRAFATTLAATTLASVADDHHCRLIDEEPRVAAPRRRRRTPVAAK